MKLKNIKDYCHDKKVILKDLINKIQGKAPVLACIQVGNNEASNRYIRNKKKDCEEVGVVFEWYHYDESISEEELIAEIHDLQPFVTGLIVQMPLPKHISETAIKMAIDPIKDIDGFHPMSQYTPCTPTGIIDYLTECGFPFEGARAAVIGRSEIVGKPMAAMLTELDSTVTLCHSKTKDLQHHLAYADLIICAVGKANFLDCKDLTKCIIVDVGINFDENGKLVGDCYNCGDNVTPVPGGVGLLTRLALLRNTYNAYLNQNKI